MFMFSGVGDGDAPNIVTEAVADGEGGGAVADAATPA